VYWTRFEPASSEYTIARHAMYSNGNLMRVRATIIAVEQQ